jgi:hypothetical protein
VCVAVRLRAGVVELSQQPPRLLENLLTRSDDDRLLEVAVPDGAGQVTDGRIAQLGGDDEPVEHVGHLGPRRTGRRRHGSEPAVEQRQDGGQLVGDALLGQEEAVHRLLQGRAGLEVGDPVVQQRTGQPCAEGLREGLTLDVQGVQVGVEVLPRAVDLLVGFLLGTGRAVAGQLGEGGEGGENGQFAVQQLGIVGGQLAARGGVLGHQLLGVPPADVVTGDQCLQRGQEGQRPVPGRARPYVTPGQLHPVTGGFLDIGPGPFEIEQRGTGVDLRVRRDEDLAHPAGEGGPHRRLHLHALQHGHRLAGLDVLAHLGTERDDDRRRRCAHHAPRVPRDPVGDPVHLDQVRADRLGGHDREALVADPQPALQCAEPVHVHVRVAPVQLDAVAVPADLGDGQAVDLAAVAEFDGVTHLVPRPGAAPACGGEERGPLHRLLRVGRVDRHLHQRRVRRRRGRGLPRGAGAVEPAGVGRAGHDLGPVEQVEEERFGRGPAPQDHGGLAQRAAQPGQRLGTVLPPGDDLRDHRVVGRGDDVTDAHAGVHPDARPGGQAQQLHLAGGRGELLLGVLGVEPRLHRVAELARRFAGEPAAGRDVQLQLHDVQAGRLLGDRVLDLQPGVDLEEGEQLLVGLVEELHGPGPDVACRLDQRHRRLAERRRLLGGQRRRARLLQDLLVAPLHRAVPDAGRPHRAVLVGDDLHLDVPAPLDQPLHEDDGIPEGAQGLGLRPGQGLLQLGFRADDADTASPAATPGLDDERIADGGGVPDTVVDTRHRSTAPRRDRHAGLLGQHLGLDLRAEQPHRRRRGPDEGHPQRGAELGEGGVLGDEAPPDPGRVGAGRLQGPPELLVVEVRVALPGLPEQDTLVGGAHERRPPFGLGV